MRVWRGLAAVAVATALYVLGLGVNGASAGTPEAADPAQLAAPTATNGAIEAAGPTMPADVAASASEPAATNQVADGVAAPAATNGAVETGDPAMPADVAPPPPEGQQAATNQVAAADAGAAQEGPINLLISVRINSPGDNGPVTQTNVVVADAGGSNTASTTQPADGVSDASTDQQAAATATATQDAAGNIVVVVRINSPGNNGPVSQTNASLAASQAQNSSGTTQGQPAQAPSPASAPAKAAAPTRPSPRPDPAPAPAQQEAAAPAAPTPVSAATSTPASQSPHATAPKAAHHHRPAANHRPKNQARAATAGRADSVTAASPLGTAIGNAGNLLGTIAPRAPLGTARQPSDVSSAVLLSLLGGLAVCAAFVGWSLRPGRLRPKRLPSPLR